MILRALALVPKWWFDNTCNRQTRPPDTTTPPASSQHQMAYPRLSSCEPNRDHTLSRPESAVVAVTIASRLLHCQHRMHSKVVWLQGSPTNTSPHMTLSIWLQSSHRDDYPPLAFRAWAIRKLAFCLTLHGPALYVCISIINLFLFLFFSFLFYIKPRLACGAGIWTQTLPVYPSAFLRAVTARSTQNTLPDIFTLLRTLCSLCPWRSTLAF